MKNCEVAEFGFGGPGHRDGPSGVAQAVARLVLDRRVRPFGFFSWSVAVAGLDGHPAALDHEVGDDPVEDQAVVEALVDILEEVLDRDRRLGPVELDR